MFSETNVTVEDLSDVGTGSSDELYLLRLRFPDVWAAIRTQADNRRPVLPDGMAPSAEPAYGFDPGLGKR